MKAFPRCVRIFPDFSVAGILVLVCVVSWSLRAQGIRYVTRHAVKSPAPGLIFAPLAVPGNQLPSANPFFAPGPVRSRNQIQNQNQRGSQPALVQKQRNVQPGVAQRPKSSPPAGHAEYSLAMYYLNRNGKVRNLHASRYWLTIAARKGNPQARTVLLKLATAARK